MTRDERAVYMQLMLPKKQSWQAYRNQLVFWTYTDPQTDIRRLTLWARQQLSEGQRSRWRRSDTYRIDDGAELNWRELFKENARANLFKETTLSFEERRAWTFDRTELMSTGTGPLLMVACKVRPELALEAARAGTTPYRLLDKFKRGAHKRYQIDIS